MKMGVTSYYFDVLTLMLEYILGQNSFLFSHLILTRMFWLL